MNWQCSYVNGDGNRCKKTAIMRLHFSYLHPFDYIDVCEDHWKGYSWKWAQFWKGGDDETSDTGSNTVRDIQPQTEGN